MVKNLPANTGAIKDVGLIPGSGKSPGGEGMATHSSILTWRILWTEELIVHGVTKSQTWLK